MKEYKVNLNGKEYIVYQDVDGKFIKPDELKVTGGTAIKPAVEPIVVARKPLSESTVANNVLKWGTGGLNIDASRIGTEERTYDLTMTSGNFETTTGGKNEKSGTATVIGRFPANIILDETTAVILDEQSGVLKSGALKSNRDVKPHNINFNSGMPSLTWQGEASFGGASRFFYVAKASKKDRNEGLDNLQDTLYAASNQAKAELKRGNTNFDDNQGKHNAVKASKNFHPTVKPTKLMEYLIKLVTPVGGTVLDPFTGSGSTGKAALLNGFKFIGCELTEEYLPIIEGRLKFAETKYKEQQSLKETEQAVTLFEIEGDK